MSDRENRQVRLILFLVLGISLLTYLTGNFFAATEGFGFQREAQSNSWAMSLANHDSMLELGLLNNGYSPYSILAIKFPLFSSLGRVLVSFLEIDGALALIIVSKLSLAGAFVSLSLLVQELHQDESITRRSLFYLIANPFLILYVFIMPYPEALYICFWALAFTYYSRGLWWHAGLCTGIAAMIRPQAIVLIIVMSIATFYQSIKIKDLKKSLLTFIDLSPLWIIGLLVYLQVILTLSDFSKTPFAPLALQNRLGRGVMHLPTTTVLNHLSYVMQGRGGFGDFIEVFQMGVFILILVSPFFVKKLSGKIPWELQAFSWGTVLLPLTTSISGIGRYALASYAVVIIPLLIPKKADKFLIPLFFAGGLVLMIAVNWQGRWGYIP